jgi:TPR repeat protein
LSHAHGIPQNSEEAVNCFENTAKKGYPAAQHAFGGMLRNGLGVKKDHNKALYWKERGGKSYPEAKDWLFKNYIK